MKLNHFLFVAVASLLVVTFLSCTNADDAVDLSQSDDGISLQTRGSDIDNSLAMNEFFQNVNQLNQQYERPFSTYAGFSIPAKVADAIVGGLASRYVKDERLLGICSSVASFLTDKFIDYVKHKKGGSVVVIPSGSGVLLDPSSVANLKFDRVSNVFTADTTKQLTFVDSVGYYHNRLLYALEKNGNSFIDSNGNINYDDAYSTAVFLDAVMHSVPQDSLPHFEVVDTVPFKGGFKFKSISFPVHPQKDTLSVDDAMKAFTVSFIRQMNSETENGFIDCFEKARINSLDLMKDADSEDTNNIRDFCQQIMTGSSGLTNAECINYCIDMNTLIDNSHISDNQKRNFKCINNIYINSQLYWDR